MAATEGHWAIAVCGCGHDGRLGMGAGAEDNVTVPTLLPTFLPDAGRSVVRVACGAYHTIAEASDGLYGWGINDCGQLGLGRGRPFAPAPTRLDYFDGKLAFNNSRSDAAATDDSERVVQIACGGRHSLVLSTHALYVAGANEDGQLGLGREPCAYTWRVLCRFRGPRDDGADYGLGSADVALPLPHLDLVRCAITHVSAGTDHTLLGLHDVLAATEEEASPRLWPVMVLAAGKGDFGELGYDGTVDEVERNRDARRQAAALDEARRREKQGGHGDVDGSGSGGATNDPLYKFKMKFQQVKRRPAFSSTAFRPVTDTEAMGLPAAISVDDASAETATTTGRRGGDWPRIVSLDASHLHSAVTLECRGDAGQETPTTTTTTTTTHWGCYYCDKVEDDSASVPRPAAGTQSPNSAEAAAAGDVRVHGGNEVLLRYAAAGSRDGPAPLWVAGKGCLGRGEEDDYADAWVALPGTEGVVKAVGRDHFLALQRAGDGACAVVGFGENLHGQLSSVAARQGSDVDVVPAPRELLRSGDIIASTTGKWSVSDVVDVGAGARHSVFLLAVKDVPA